ncbi:MAG: hypothetical protein NTY32_08255 [Bacteroidia bacterium]|nr:hypothetical protein [Bacteroidia bacterium]
MTTQEYVSIKLGYGNPESKIWFIGPEEGGNYDKENRKKAWEKTTNESYADIYEFHKNYETIIGNDMTSNALKYFDNPGNKTNKPVLQSTWGSIIEIILGLYGDDVNTLNKRIYQATKFGRSKSENCILELSPYSSKNLIDSTFKNKKEVLEELIPNRIKLIANEIKKYRPAVVFLYSKSNRDNWIKLISEVLKPDEIKLVNLNSAPAEYVQTDYATFVLIDHPISRTLNGKKESIGKEIRQIIKEDLKLHL